MDKMAVVGMSGGVDSSVSALLLKEQGYRVVGLFMKNWEERDENGVCRSAQDAEDASRVCEQLGIPFYGVEFVREYWDQVFTRFLEDYRSGYTPNPDVLCNREIKFNVFLRKAKELGADFLATGHYCRSARVAPAGEPRLLKGVDSGKDQTYFTYTLGREALKQVLFPVGNLKKAEVRDLARRHGLATSEKRDSTGICFIGERKFREFLGRYVASSVGKFRTLDGRIVGEHLGAVFYTIGQRRGLGLGGEGEAWYVVGKEMSDNTVFVERGDDHPALYADELLASEASWVSGQPPSAFPFRCRAKIRYRQADQDCVVSEVPDRPGAYRVVFDLPQRAITPRQSVVFYDGEECLGGAFIESAGPSYHAQGKPLPPSLAFSRPSSKSPDPDGMSQRQPPCPGSRVPA